LALAVELVRWLVRWLDDTGKALRLVVDGAYAKRPSLRPVAQLGVVVFRRLRKDARLQGLPPARRPRGRRGPRPRYGKGRIDLAKRAGQKRGWRRAECVQYGKRVAESTDAGMPAAIPAEGCRVTICEGFRRPLVINKRGAAKAAVGCKGARS
jgi:hypothetical protein